ncbi:uncharacterized protein LOC131670882 [Phymastichus coffea]|uniref:uncharacterized protein LOC131670882 n=1 Tax=Phymastichus coffea TaxID=108790 RepID=UPI00273AB501|nr:uncharacterized protein LOC131670882 [Phymastichus coffea]
MNLKALATVHPTSIVLTLILFIQSEGAILNVDDEEFFGKEADRINWSLHPCRRKCMDGEAPKVCKYVFVIEKFSSMSKACYNCPFNITDCFRPHCIPTDGVQKPVYVADRQLPGPLIEVCQNDWVVVEVRNRMATESFTIHWHGFKQMGTPYSDGVPFVTQCPISPGNRYQYYFNATTTGTFFWHSHTGSQRSDGFFGPMVINDVHSQDVYVDQYDYDIHRLVINDWKDRPADEDEIHDNYDRFNAITETILINGYGRYVNFTDANGTAIDMPTAIIQVESGKKYRIRTINAGSENCPMEMSIDNHTLLVIALDSRYIKPVEVDVVTFWSGERVDFILNATQTPANYWIRVRGLSRCATANANQIAILNYANVTVNDPKEPVGYQYPIATNTTRVLNPIDRGTESDPRIFISIPNLVAVDKDDLCLKAEVDRQIFINLDTMAIDNYDYHRRNLYGYNEVAADRRLISLQLNHITMKFPPFPLLSQYESITPDMLCNSSYIPSGANCTVDYCACTHVINLKLNEVVELVMIDQGLAARIDHPMHLHGHFFRVVASVSLNETMTVAQFKRLDKQGKIQRNLNHAPIKDTMKVPSGGYSIVRFLANNPGYWYFHCHFEPHSNNGMSFVFKVGEHEDFPKKPDGFPTCGPFTPEKFN